MEMPPWLYRILPECWVLGGGREEGGGGNEEFKLTGLYTETECRQIVSMGFDWTVNYEEQIRDISLLHELWSRNHEWSLEIFSIYLS